VSTVEFLQAFQEFLGRNGWPTKLSPWAIVEQWERLVDKASDYRWGVYEFNNDLSVRDLLAKAFDDPLLSGFEHVNLMRDRVEHADRRFQELLLPGAEIAEGDEPWWRRSVLASAGQDYADDVKRLYGIDLAR
jgi:hypothetical protein